MSTFSPNWSGRYFREVDSCNDGVFLKPLGEAGYQAVGIDACENVVRMAQSEGLQVRLGVFGRKTAKELKEEYGAFDVVTCSNVFAHNPNLHGFLEGVSLLLKSPRAEFWVEVHSANRLHDGLQWDCFYHEHCFYWTLDSLQKCLHQHGLYLQRSKTVPMHGGALRAVFSRTRSSYVSEDRPLTAEDWQRFGAKCVRSREIIRAAFEALPLRYAYGAAGRAVTLINWTGIAPHLAFVVDGSPLRYHRAIPNSAVPIISEDEFAKYPELNGWCFVSAHNYLADIRKKVDAYFPGREVKYVTPLPHVSIQ